jgi:hypothetical protein
MGKKTFKVEDLKMTINAILKESAPEQICVRQGMMNILEQVLHSTGNYSGYKYLIKGQVPNGSRPGINVGETGGCETLEYQARFADTDNTRVEYF